MAKKKKSTKIENRTMPVNWPLTLGLCAALILLCAAGYFLSERGGDSAARAVVSPVVFSEVMTANTSSVKDDFGAYADWFEITNDSERAVSLNGWIVTHDGDGPDFFKFGNQTIAPHEHIVVFAGDYAANNPDYYLHAPFGLTASGEKLFLMDREGVVMDSVTVPALERNQVYALTEDGWSVTAEYTPGMANTPANHVAWLAAADGADKSGAEISEVMIRNASAIRDDKGAFSDYIEIHNGTNRAINLRGYTLTDDASAPQKFVFPDVSVAAGGYLLVFASGEEQRAGTLHAPFKLSKGETVTFLSPSGLTLSAVTPQTDGADQAWSLTKNGWTALYPPTPGAANDEYGVGSIDQTVSAANGTHLHISEIMAKAESTEYGGGYYDWIEIYNDAGGTLDLSGWGLSDKSSHPRKWQFPSGASIAPGQYMLVYCSGLDTRKGDAYHTDFSLSDEGGYSVTLCDPQGGIVDRMAVPRQYADTSYGRSYGVSGLRFFLEPTPGAANTTYGYTGRCEQASFSVKGGMYAAGDSVTVELSCAPGSTIYYTTDCSDPDTSSAIYSKPITLNQTTILRARVYSTSEIPSFVTTESYFFGESHTVRVVSVVTDPDNLWDDSIGIYTMGPNDTEAKNGLHYGANFWQDWERAANVEIFTTDGGTLLSQQCGIKIAGQFSREDDQKGLRLIARDDYGDEDRFNAPLFTERPYTWYHSFVLRACGQDKTKTRIRDVLQTSLADATDVMYQAAEICVVYLNGQYWGHYNMREHISKYSIAQWMGWTSDVNYIDIVKANRDVMQGSNDTFAQLLNWIKNEGGATAREKRETLTQEDYDEILAYISQYVDVDNYIDYVILETYVSHSDLLNVKRYRSANEDGKWRWILFDLDWGLTHLDYNTVRRWLNPEGVGEGKKTDNTLFVELMKNPKIQDKYLKRFNELYVSTFNTEEMLARMNTLATTLEPEIDRALARWNLSRERYDKSWQSLRSFVAERPDYVMQYIQETFSLSDTEMEEYFGESLKLISTYKALHG